jgi:hypothetical protein
MGTRKDGVIILFSVLHRVVNVPKGVSLRSLDQNRRNRNLFTLIMTVWPKIRCKTCLTADAYSVVWKRRSECQNRCGKDVSAQDAIQSNVLSRDFVAPLSLIRALFFWQECSVMIRRTSHFQCNTSIWPPQHHVCLQVIPDVSFVCLEKK